MKLRLEVGRTKNFTWQWFERQARQHKSHALTQDGKLEVHSLEFTSAEEFAAFYDLVRSWKMVSVFKDGKLISRSDAFRIMWQARTVDREISDLTRALRATRRPPPDPGF